MTERKRKVASPRVILGRFKYGSDSTFVDFLHEQGDIYDLKKDEANAARAKAIAAKKDDALETEKVVLSLRQETVDKGKPVIVKRIAEKAKTSAATVYRIFEKAGYGKYKRTQSKKDSHS